MLHNGTELISRLKMLHHSTEFISSWRMFQYGDQIDIDRGRTCYITAASDINSELILRLKHGGKLILRSW